MSLLSAFAVYWMFGLLSSVATYTWVPFSGFLASIFHFGISSWLFLHFPKPGKVLAFLTGTIMCIWPTIAFFGTLTQFDLFQTTIYFLPLVFSGLVFYNHIKTFKHDTRPALATRIILSVIPLGLFIAYIVHIVTMIKLERITFGK
jgi:hypothetical protein